jgi:hypothetical protein
MALEQIGRLLVEQLADPAQHHQQRFECLGGQRVHRERRQIAFEVAPPLSPASGSRRLTCGPCGRGRRFGRWRGFGGRQGPPTGEMGDARVECCVHVLHRCGIAAAVGVQFERQATARCSHLYQRRRPVEAEHGERVGVGHVPG